MSETKLSSLVLDLAVLLSLSFPEVFLSKRGLRHALLLHFHVIIQSPMDVVVRSGGREYVL